MQCDKAQMSQWVFAAPQQHLGRCLNWAARESTAKSYLTLRSGGIVAPWRFRRDNDGQTKTFRSGKSNALGPGFRSLRRLP